MITKGINGKVDIKSGESWLRKQEENVLDN